MKKLFALFALLALILICASALAACEHSLYLAQATTPDCDTDGYLLYKCHNCSYSEKRLNGKAPGHFWKVYATDPSTCTTKGTKYYECSLCGGRKTESIAKLPHKWKTIETLKEATCKQAGEKLLRCTECNSNDFQAIPKAHKYGSWKVTQEPSDHTLGKRERTCKYCNRKEKDDFYPEGTLYKNIKNKKAEVKALQQQLKDLGYSKSGVDGSYGSKTVSGVKAAQKAFGLKVDGIAWPQTIKAVDDAWKAKFASTPEPTSVPTPEPTAIPTPRPLASFCVMGTDENGIEQWDLCAAHQMDADADAWQAELDRLYQAWIDLAAKEDRPVIVNHKISFQGYLSSQQMLWNTQFGAGSEKALALKTEMLKEQCCTLCGSVYSLAH